jgi:ABC-type methionine transport system ATPase subunit
VLDEPTAGVDVEATSAIMKVLVRLNRDEGLTVLLVTHQARVLRGTVSSVVLVQDGRATRRKLGDVLGPAAVDMPGSSE